MTVKKVKLKPGASREGWSQRKPAVVIDVSKADIAAAEAIHQRGLAKPAVPATIVPMDLVSRAFAAGNLDLVERAMVLQQKWEADQARKAFDAAIAAAKGELPLIVKNRQVDFTSTKGRTQYRYEDFGGLAAQIDPVLAKHGLGYRFNTQVTDKLLMVTCILFHSDGHREENTLSAGHDTSGNKNSIQAIGSTQTYLQRYTLKAALGLAASHDDDARAVNASAEEAAVNNEPISAEQLDTLTEALAFREMPEERLIKWVKVAYRSPAAAAIETLADIPARIYDVCLQKIQHTEEVAP